MSKDIFLTAEELCATMNRPKASCALATSESRSRWPEKSSSELWPRFSGQAVRSPQWTIGSRQKIENWKLETLLPEWRTTYSGQRTGVSVVGRE